MSSKVDCVEKRAVLAGETTDALASGERGGHGARDVFRAPPRGWVDRDGDKFKMFCFSSLGMSACSLFFESPCRVEGTLSECA